jgi:Flp pilus assembly protein protease CpaA
MASTNWMNWIAHPALRSGIGVSQFLVAGTILALILGYAWFHDVYRDRIIPDYISLPLIVIGIAFAPFIYAHPWQVWLTGLLLPLFILVFGATMNGKFGMGDVKLLTAFALLLGPGVLLVMVISSLFGLVWSLPTMWRYFGSRSQSSNSKENSSRRSFPWRIPAALSLIIGGMFCIFIALASLAKEQASLASTYSRTLGFAGAFSALIFFYLGIKFYKQHRQLRPLKESVMGEAIPFGPSIILAFPAVLYIGGLSSLVVGGFVAVIVAFAFFLRFFATPIRSWWERVQREAEEELEKEKQEKIVTEPSPVITSE